jgi:hypothetical protein
MRHVTQVHPHRRLPLLLQDSICTPHSPLLITHTRAHSHTRRPDIVHWSSSHVIESIQSKTEVGRLTIQPRNTKPADPAVTGRANCLEVRASPHSAAV